MVLSLIPRSLVFIRFLHGRSTRISKVSCYWPVMLFLMASTTGLKPDTPLLEYPSVKRIIICGSVIWPEDSCCAWSLLRILLATCKASEVYVPPPDIIQNRIRVGLISGSECDYRAQLTNYHNNNQFNQGGLHRIAGVFVASFRGKKQGSCIV